MFNDSMFYVSKDRKLMMAAITAVIIETPENLCSLILYPLGGKQAEAKNQFSSE